MLEVFATGTESASNSVIFNTSVEKRRMPGITLFVLWFRE
jgi:hypothetical protein